MHTIGRCTGVAELTAPSAGHYDREHTYGEAQAGTADGARLLGAAHKRPAVSEFQWDDANVDHIAEHQVNPEEAEEALTDPDRRPLGAYSPPHESRWAVLGATEGNRILVVIYTRRGHLLRVVTAREASGPERRSYRRRQKRSKS